MRKPPTFNKIMTCIIHTLHFLHAKTPFLRRFTTTPKSLNLKPTSKPKPRPKPIPIPTTLTHQQKSLLSAVSNRRSIFLTGSAGTGKSFILLQAIQILNQLHDPNTVFVTASTGVAACALSGQTLHSFAGIGLGEGDKNLLLTRVKKNKRAAKRWEQANALVIDEISMISSDMFDKLEYIARMIRRDKSTPWGGIQLIVSGDFFQLPPIIKNAESHRVFAFEADCWIGSFDLQLQLTQVFRQVDASLVNLLQGIRKGARDEELLRTLRQCDREPVEEKSGGTVPRLYPMNQDVKRVNEKRLAGLSAERVMFKAMDSGIQPFKTQLKQGIAPEELEICVGARVMLIKNKDVQRGLTNGATGTVTGFVLGRRVKSICSQGLLPKVIFDSGLEMVIEPEKWEVMEGETALATRKQIPLILAWALSIHKCQGMTINALHTDLSRAFGCGMVYVALSRIRSLDGLYLTGFNSSKIKAHPKVLQYYQDQLGG